jgi:hypothetical protein
MSAGSDAADDTLDDAADAVQEQGLDEGADMRPASGEQMSLQMQPEATSAGADDLAPPPIAAAPVQVSWTGLAPPAAIEPAAVTPPAAIEPEPTVQAQSVEAESPVATEPAAATEKKVVWSSSPSNSTISFGPGYSSRRDDL